MLTMPRALRVGLFLVCFGLIGMFLISKTGIFSEPYFSIFLMGCFFTALEIYRYLKRKRKI
jgi:hypothetical protein